MQELLSNGTPHSSHAQVSHTAFNVNNFDRSFKIADNVYAE